MRDSKVWLISALGLISIGFASQAQSAIYTADFSSSILDANLLLRSQEDWTVTSGGGVLEFSSLGNPASLTSSAVKYAQYLNGDFTATVNVDITNASNVTASLYFTGDAGSGLNTNISAWKAPYFLPGYSNIGGWDPVTNTMPTNVYGLANILTLQLSRTGDLFSESYKAVGANDFILWHTFDASQWHGVGGYVGIQARQHQVALMNTDVKYSSFEIEHSVPEPESLALFGIAMLAALSVRKKKF